MKHVVITAGMRGIGFGMARGFLRRGHQVTVCGRSANGTERASALLAAEHDGERLAAASCDVGDYDQVRDLWEEALGRFGAVDVWINNAGLRNPSRGFWGLEAGLVEEVARADVLGVMHGSKAAMRGCWSRATARSTTWRALAAVAWSVPARSCTERPFRPDGPITKPKSPATGSRCDPGAVVSGSSDRGKAGRSSRPQRANRPVG